MRTRKQTAAWKHNSFLGYAALGRKNMQTIINSETATPRSKRLASEIITKLEDLAGSLKERKPL